MDKPIVGFDSNVLTFLVEATNGQYTAPADDPLRDEKIAAFRLILFCDSFNLPTVTREANAMRDAAWRASPSDTIAVVLGEFDPIEIDLVGIWRRAKVFEHAHTGSDDCQLLAEAEFADVPILVTLDRDFRTRLGPLTAVRLLTPVECCKQLGIPDNYKPHWTPRPTNPLSQQTWWRWPA